MATSNRWMSVAEANEFVAELYTGEIERAVLEVRRRHAAGTDEELAYLEQRMRAGMATLKPEFLKVWQKWLADYIADTN